MHREHETTEVRGVRRTDEKRGLVGINKNSGLSVSRTPSELSSLTLTGGLLKQLRTRGNCERRQGKERNVSWQNGSLQRKTESVRPFVKPGTHLNVLSMHPVRETNFQNVYVGNWLHLNGNDMVYQYDLTRI